MDKRTLARLKAVISLVLSVVGLIFIAIAVFTDIKGPNLAIGLVCCGLSYLFAMIALDFSLNFCKLLTTQLPKKRLPSSNVGS